MARNLRDSSQPYTAHPFATASSDTPLPAFAAPVEAEGIARARALATGLKRRLKTAQLPAPVVEASYLLEESRDPDCPLLERLRILGLLASVLDHYFVDQAPALAESEQEDIAAKLDPLLQQAYVDLDDSLLPALSEEFRINIRRPHELDRQQHEYLRRFFRQQLYPMLTPLAVDPGHPFPFISSHSINLLVHLRGPDIGVGPLSYARIKVPRLMSRFVSVPSSTEMRQFHLERRCGGGLSERTFSWNADRKRISIPRPTRIEWSRKRGRAGGAEPRAAPSANWLYQWHGWKWRRQCPNPWSNGWHLSCQCRFNAAFIVSAGWHCLQLVDLANLAHTWNQ